MWIVAVPTHQQSLRECCLSELAINKLVEILILPSAHTALNVEPMNEITNHLDKWVFGRLRYELNFFSTWNGRILVSIGGKLHDIFYVAVSCIMEIWHRSSPGTLN